MPKIFKDTLKKFILMQVRINVYIVVKNLLAVGD